MTQYNRGRWYEYKTIDLFEKMGEQCIARNAGSHRIADLVFATPDCFRLVQVKSGNARLSEQELAKFHQLQIPKGTKLTLVSWSLVKGKAVPDLIDVGLESRQALCNTHRKPVHRARKSRSHG